MLNEIAKALRYPNPRPQRLEFASDFFDETAHVDDRGLEELYTTTFDLNPVATLEIGWHLWGEQYERGRFLADLRAVQERAGIDAGCELPDHLTVLLPTIEATDSDDLREKCAKGLEKILKTLDEQGNPYRHLLRAALNTLAPRSGERVVAPASEANGPRPGEGRPPHPAFGHLLPRGAGEKAIDQELS